MIRQSLAHLAGSRNLARRNDDTVRPNLDTETHAPRLFCAAT
jgi:hypothetical protein